MVQKGHSQLEANRLYLHKDIWLRGKVFLKEKGIFMKIYPQFLLRIQAVETEWIPMKKMKQLILVYKGCRREI
jgi:hypothetical protein